MFRWEAGVFIEVECDDVLERESVLLVKADEFLVITDGCRTCGQSQNGGLTCYVIVADQCGRIRSQLGGSRFGSWENFNRNFVHGGVLS